MIRAAWLVARKDLKVLLRDRQTVIHAILIPLALYPVLFWVLLQASTLIEGRRESMDSRIAVFAHHGAELRAEPLLRELGGAGESGQGTQRSAADFVSQRLTLVEPPTPDGALDAGDEALGAGDGDLGADGTRDALEQRASEAVRGERIDAALVVPVEGPLRLLIDRARPRSELAEGRTREFLEGLGASQLRARLDQVGLSESSLAPFDVDRIDLSPPEQLGSFVASMLLPMMLVLMSLSGAFYPAVDLTAGERERGTEETGLLAPLPREATQTGRLIAVSTFGLFAAALNLLGMSLAAGHLLSMMGMEQIGFSIDPLRLALLVPLTVPLVVFISAVLLAFASLADTFRQAQSMLGAVQLVFVAPALASSLPGIDLTASIAAVPIVGFSIAMRTILRVDAIGDLPWFELGITALALLVQAWIAVRLSARFTGRELDTGDSGQALARLRSALLPRTSGTR
jgi:sodium transport system permease protein